MNRQALDTPWKDLERVVALARISQGATDFRLERYLVGCKAGASTASPSSRNTAAAG